MKKEVAPRFLSRLGEEDEDASMGLAKRFMESGLFGSL